MRYVQFLIRWCEDTNLHVITGRFTMFCTEVCVAMQMLRGLIADYLPENRRSGSRKAGTRAIGVAACEGARSAVRGEASSPAAGEAWAFCVRAFVSVFSQPMYRSKGQKLIAIRDAGESGRIAIGGYRLAL